MLLIIVSFSFDQFIVITLTFLMLITLLLLFRGRALLFNGSLGLRFPQKASSMAMLMPHTWTTIPYFIPQQ